MLRAGVSWRGSVICHVGTVKSYGAWRLVPTCATSAWCVAVVVERVVRSLRGYVEPATHAQVVDAAVGRLVQRTHCLENDIVETSVPFARAAAALPELLDGVVPSDVGSARAGDTLAVLKCLGMERPIDSSRHRVSEHEAMDVRVTK